MRRKYPLPVRILHWLMSVLILSMIAIGWYMHQLPDDAPNKYALYPWHKSFGMLLLVLWCVRTVVVSLAHKPSYFGLTDGQVKLAAVFHRVMYVLMLMLPVSGYMMSSAAGFDVDVFGVTLPNLIGENEEIAKRAHRAHEVLPWVLLGLVGLHVAAVIKHSKIDRVNILKRML